MSFLRPYLATIKDSFREALASRVLWIMLILITLLLLSIAPLSIRRELTWRLDGFDIVDVKQLAAQLVFDATNDEPSPGKHVWGKLKGDLRKQVEEAAKPDTELRTLFRLQRDLTEALNDLLERKDLFDRDAWQGAGIGKEARELLDQNPNHLSENQLARRNRLLLEAAWPNLIRMSGQTSIRMRYLFWDITPPMPVTEEQLDLGISVALNSFMSIFVGVIGIIVAILVTSPIIPQTFEAGSIELLLSKPVSRTLLFLSKFLGGCAFVLVNAAYLIVGLWLIVGLRMGVWNHRLLLCIPIFLFLFAIYYSVSALAGMIWRSAIVAVIVTILFWATCFTVGFSKGLIEGFVFQPKRIEHIVQAGETLVSVNRSGQAKRWDPDSRQWMDVFQLAEGGQTEPQPFFLMPRVELGPVYDAPHDRLIAVGASSTGGRGFGMGAALWIASPERQYKRVEGAPTPAGSTDLFLAPDGTLVTVSPRGPHRLAGDPESRGGGLSLMGVELPVPGGGSPFALAGPDPPLAVLPPSAAAMNGSSGELAIVTRGSLVALTLGEDGRYQRRRERKIKDADKPSVLAYAGNTLLLAHDDGSVRVIDAENLSVLQTLEPEGSNSVRFIEASPTGRWLALVFHNGRLHLFDTQQRQLVRRRFSGQGDISAAAFIDDDTLLVADRTTRISFYDVANNQQVKRLSPKMDLFERTYRFAIIPLYTIYPKPGELDNTTQYLLTDQETVSPMATDLRQAQIKLDPWAPVWSSALFMIVVLAIACVYLWRADL